MSISDLGFRIIRILTDINREQQAQTALLKEIRDSLKIVEASKLVLTFGKAVPQ